MIHQICQQQVEREECRRQEESNSLGVIRHSRVIVKMKITKKKKKSETGAKVLISLAKGPGCSLAGIAMPMR